jgi:hypothetical protein
MTRLERDLERVLEDLADNFPLLRSLVDRRAGGQKRLPMPGRGDLRVQAPLVTHLSAGHESAGEEFTGGGAETGPSEGAPTPAPPAPPTEEEQPGADSAPPDSEPLASAEGQSHDHLAAAAGPDTVAGRRRPARYGLLVQLESRQDDPELGRLVDSTIWINDAHPAYTRAVASRSLGYHTALTVALALAPLAVEAPNEHAFITQFLAHWGSAQAATLKPRRRRPKTR